MKKFVTYIPASEGKETPWKNGAGFTREIAIEPQGADFKAQDFLWRLSAAKLQSSNEFSEFKGYNRWITLVEGKEIVLDLNDGQEMAALRSGDNFSFSGADKVKCELPKGEAKDLGIIYKDGAVAAEMNTVRFAGKVRSFKLQSRTVFFYVLEGSFSISAFPGEHNFSVKKGDVLRVDPAGKEERIILCAPGELKGSALVAVELDW